MIIYKITNLANGKLYIGKTIKSLAHRWSGHKHQARRLSTDMIITRAIRKYGENNFSIEQIDSANSKSELKLKEFYWIKKLQTTKPHIGYNLRSGSEEGQDAISPKTILKIFNSKRLNKTWRANNSLKSKFVGVCFNRQKQSWSFYIYAGGLKRRQVRFLTDYDAAVARDYKLLEILPRKQALSLMNFPSKISEYLAKKVVYNLKPLLIKPKLSKFTGVTFVHGTKKWSAEVKHNGKRIKIGTFLDESQAAEMADWIRIQNKIDSPLNFPKVKYRHPDYQPPKTIRQKRPLPEFIFPWVNKAGKTRYQVVYRPSDPLQKRRGVFDTLDEAQVFVASFCKS